MKVIAFILACIITLQTFKVAGSNACCAEMYHEGKTESVIEQVPASCCSSSNHCSEQEEDKEEAPKDNCGSKMCNCFCCISCVVFTLNYSIKTYQGELLADPFSIPSLHSFDFVYHIWIPPREAASFEVV